MKMQRKPEEFPVTPQIPEVNPGKETPMPGIPPEQPEPLPIEKPDPDETPSPLTPPEENASDKFIKHSVK